MRLKKCDKCGYSLKDECVKCGEKARDAHYKVLRLRDVKEKKSK